MTKIQINQDNHCVHMYNQQSCTWHASAPGSLMLLGEHAVLHNKPAIVLAINRRINVTLQARLDKKIYINSQQFGELWLNLNDKIIIQQPFSFILNAIKLMQPNLSQGFDLYIQAEFSSTLGFGSSSAVTVATIAVLLAYSQNKQSTSVNMLTHKFKLQVFKLAYKVILMTQGLGSGADVSASVFGGIVAYRKHPLHIHKINIKPINLTNIDKQIPIVIAYSGSKTPTTEVVKQVYSMRKKHDKIFKKLESLAENCVKDAIKAIKNNNLLMLGEILNIAQGIHDSFGVNTLQLSQIIFTLRQMHAIYGAKISGSGLGDCVIAIGNLDANFLANLKFCDIIDNIKICDQGLELLNNNFRDN